MEDTFFSLEGKVENLSSKVGKLDRRMVNVEQRMEKSEARTSSVKKKSLRINLYLKCDFKKMLLSRMRIEDIGLENTGRCE